MSWTTLNGRPVKVKDEYWVPGARLLYTGEGKSDEYVCVAGDKIPDAYWNNSAYDTLHAVGNLVDNRWVYYDNTPFTPESTGSVHRHSQTAKYYSALIPAKFVPKETQNEWGPVSP
jgi:hypothetical protein